MTSSKLHLAPVEQGQGMIWGIIAATSLIAMTLSVYQLTRPGMLFGLTEYDDGVYFGSAIRLVNGALPYRDFVLVHPPGFELLASPVALVSRASGTRDAMAVVRLCMPLVAALNVLLVGALIRHRGRLPTLVGAGMMAIFPAEVGATHTALLEPVLDLFCLLGALLVFHGEMLGGRRQLLLGGVAMGFAGTVKVWAVIPVLVIAVLCLPQVWRRLAPFISGVAIGFAVPTLPFVIAAPGSFYRDVVTTQLARVAGSGRIPFTIRLAPGDRDRGRGHRSACPVDWAPNHIRVVCRGIDGRSRRASDVAGTVLRPLRRLYRALSGHSGRQRRWAPGAADFSANRFGDRRAWTHRAYSQPCESHRRRACGGQGPEHRCRHSGGRMCPGGQSGGPDHRRPFCFGLARLRRQHHRSVWHHHLVWRLEACSGGGMAARLREH
ncbi:MAG: phospholipid carrier-dependent glycosyltransferase [Chloroflexi bacterium]|nr:MAG: phospholipid carrier-dependent glycosyltransferase [Chloroflexota bacterium]